MRQGYLIQVSLDREIEVWPLLKAAASFNREPPLNSPVDEFPKSRICVLPAKK
jgi:hypothetical protein